MFQIKYKDNLYKLPINVTETDEILRQINSIVQSDGQEFILSFNHIFLSNRVNYKLLEIGYSPYEVLEAHHVFKKRTFFNVVAYNYDYHKEVDQYTNVFTAKQHFADLFYTVPQNIIIKCKDKVLSDSELISSFETTKNDPIQISVDENHFLVRTYLSEHHFACMPLNSTFQNLKDTLSVYSKKDLTIAPCEYSDDLIDICKQLKLNDVDDIDESKLQKFTSNIPLFEFDESTKKNSKVYKITATVKDEKFNITRSREYDVSYNTNIYSVTVLLEKDLKIDRGLFILYSKSDDKLNLNLVISPEKKNVIFKISNHLNVKVNNKSEVWSYLTTLEEIQNLNEFDNHNFGFVVNNHYAYYLPTDKFLLIHFMNDTKSDNSIMLKESLSPSYQKTFTHVNSGGEKISIKHFIIPKTMEKEEISANYLHRNYYSIHIKAKNEEEVVYRYTHKLKIYYTLIDKSKEINSTVEVFGEQPRVIDFLRELYNQKHAKADFKPLGWLINKAQGVYEVAVPSFKGKKLNFWDSLSDIYTDPNNRIKIKGLEGQKNIFIMNLSNQRKGYRFVRFFIN